MPGNQLILNISRSWRRECAFGALPRHERQTRRDFLTAAIAGGAALLLADCSGSDTTRPAVGTGRVTGDVVDLAGVPQRSLGRVYLMYESGLQTGRFIDVDAQGLFAFDDVPEGRWQVRFYAPGVAYVPEQLANPVRISVTAGQTSSVHFAVQRGWEDGAPMVEIYIGDYFFQEQPLGVPNAVTIVKVGTPVCWYNVGSVDHTTTGGLWDSGPISGTGAFVWVPDRLGSFPYNCRFHTTQMIASLQVVS